MLGINQIIHVGMKHTLRKVNVINNPGIPALVDLSLVDNSTEIPFGFFNNQGVDSIYSWFTDDNTLATGVVAVIEPNKTTFDPMLALHNFFSLRPEFIPLNITDPYPGNYSSDALTLSYKSGPVGGFNYDYPIPNTFAAGHVAILGGNASDPEGAKKALDQALSSMYNATYTHSGWNLQSFIILTSIVVSLCLLYKYSDTIAEKLGKGWNYLSTAYDNSYCAREQANRDDALESDDEEAAAVEPNQKNTTKASVAKKNNKDAALESDDEEAATGTKQKDATKASVASKKPWFTWKGLSTVSSSSTKTKGDKDAAALESDEDVEAGPTSPTTFKKKDDNWTRKQRNKDDVLDSDEEETTYNGVNLRGTLTPRTSY